MSAGHLVVAFLLGLYGFVAVLQAPHRPDPENRQFAAGLGCGIVLGIVALLLGGGLLAMWIDG